MLFCGNKLAGTTSYSNIARLVSCFNQQMSDTEMVTFQDSSQDYNIDQYDFFSSPKTFSAASDKLRNTDNYRPTTAPSNITPKRDNAIFTNCYHESATLSAKEDSYCNSLLPLRGKADQDLRSVAEIPVRFQPVFQSFPYFNVVQSKVMDDVLYSDKSVVVCAPTGSGKTVIFELAIVRLLMNLTDMNEEFKIIYMAPIKALCSERYNDWKEKFQRFGITCCELTGDTEVNDYEQLQTVNIVFTTPEKWDSSTRRWRHYRFLVNLVKLFLIDEIHILNDPNRGATVEAVISRMMTIHNGFNQHTSASDEFVQRSMRFIAVSATIPNTNDVAEWFAYGGRTSACYNMGEDLRPVKLKKIVIGYPFQHNSSEFRFDFSLSYKLINIINMYSDGKPTLVFCSTRKGAIQTAGILVNEGKLILSSNLKQKLKRIGNCLRDNKLKDIVSAGVGFHHAGLDFHDRNIVEELFSNGELPILVATSTLAMGVNLPAHLVIIKSTMFYDSGHYIEYNDTQILQMIGRAGRPQFDTSATAVIMTKDTLKMKYEKFLNGMQIVESRLHTHLAEYLNAEIVLLTITDVHVAMQWIRLTFLYIRIMKNPKYYGISADLTRSQIEHQLQEMCLKELNGLVSAHLIIMDDDGFDLKSTEMGKLMARYCVSVESMRKFGQIQDTETMKNLLLLISRCSEFSEIQLRTSEKKILNTLNKDKHLPTIRFPMSGRICTREMKINCLIQAVFGCIAIQDWALSQETTKILRTAQRLSKCLSECVEVRNDFKLVSMCMLLAKCFRAKLWENSHHISRQLERIGNALSKNLVNAGLITFQKIEDTNPRQLEMILNRHPPFGNHIHDAVALLPKYEICIEQLPKYHLKTADFTITVILKNYELMSEKKVLPSGYAAVLLVGDQHNNIVLKQRLVHTSFSNAGQWSKHLSISQAANGQELVFKLINQQYVGLDLNGTYTPSYVGGQNISGEWRFATNSTIDKNTHSLGDESENEDDEGTKSGGSLWTIDLSKGQRTALKSAPKTAVGNSKTSKLSKKNASKPVKASSNNAFSKFFNTVQDRVEALPSINYPKKRLWQENSDTSEDKAKINLSQFQYQPTTKLTCSFHQTSQTSASNVEMKVPQKAAKLPEIQETAYYDFRFDLVENNSSYDELELCQSEVVEEEQFPDEDNDLFLLHYENKTYNEPKDLPSFTVEDFQETEDSDIALQPANLKFNYFSQSERKNEVPNSVSLCNKRNVKYITSAFPWKSEKLAGVTLNSNATEIYSSERELSTHPQQRQLSDFNQLPYHPAKSDFISASEVYNDVLKSEKVSVQTSSDLLDPGDFSDEMDVLDDSISINESSNDLQQFSTPNGLPLSNSKSLPPPSLKEALHSEKELKDAMDTFKHIFSDLF